MPPPPARPPENTQSTGFSQPGGMLPATLTPLVGRKQELGRLSRILAEHAVRLMVLTGPGGVGKTRLALALADLLKEHYRDGVVLVNLNPVTSVEGVLPAIASVLGVREAKADYLHTAIRKTLQGKEMLVVLDNFEHVVHAAPLLTELLASSHDLTMLVTSRSVLDVYGEVVFPVPPMPVPNDVGASLKEIGDSGAVQLFIDRVRALHPEFRLTAQNAQDIATICTRLDGLPLAIELAAARTSLFTISMLAERLDHRLSVLESGPRDVPGRLRTMRNAISWSYELLTAREQAVFRRLAIFVGVWNLEAAQAIGMPDEMDDIEIIEAIGSLVDKSLVQRVDVNDQVGSFRLLQTLREFALEALEATGEYEQVAEHHALYMLALAERAQPHLTGQSQIFWLNTLESRHGDLRAAFNLMMHTEPPELALRLVTSIWRFAYTRGHILETRAWLARALERAPERTALRAKALSGAGVLSNMAGNVGATRAAYEEALDIAREVDDPRTMATALSGLGDLAMIDLDTREAERRYEEAEHINIRLDDARGIAVAQTNLGNAYWSSQRIQDALKLNEAARRLYESVGDQRGVAWSLTNVGKLAAGQKQYGRAIANLSGAMELYDLLGDRSGIAETLESFALVGAGVGDFTRGATLLGAADNLRKILGHPIPRQDLELYEEMSRRIRQELGEDFATHWDTGQGLHLDDAIALGIGIEAPELTAKAPELGSGDASRRIIESRGITDRELEVLQYLGAGESDKQIASRLFISVRTVQTHVQNLLNKFDASSRSAAVARAFRDGILT